MALAVAPVAARASHTVSNTGRSRCFVPPLPGVTPPMTLVPYAIACSEWNVPWAPVKPCVMTRVLASTRMAMSDGLLHSGNDLLGGIGQIVGRNDWQVGFRQDLLAEIHVGAFQAD